MTAPLKTNERLAIVEQKVSHHKRVHARLQRAMQAELAKVSRKVDEMHAILLQARGVRHQRVHARLRRAMAVIAVSGVVGFLAGISHWIIGKT